MVSCGDSCLLNSVTEYMLGWKRIFVEERWFTEWNPINRSVTRDSPCYLSFDSGSKTSQLSLSRYTLV